MLKSIIIAAISLLPLCIYAQIVLTGVVRDVQSRQTLAGATVSLRGSADNFAVTDEFGRFKFGKLPSGTYSIQAKFLGYADNSLTINLKEDTEVTIALNATSILTEAVVVSATRATDKTPTTFTTLSKEKIQQQNLGQDLPFLLNWTPSAVTTSDAGTGIGYTGIRIRGSDATRINVTINGIPYNDSESLGTFWVNIPDIASSSQSIQIQRGVGTSTNGAGAFGGTINVQTNQRNDSPYAEVMNSFGSFKTHRHTLNFGTGLLNDHFVVDGRISKIASDGFIDRASADLQSYYLSAGFYTNKTLMKAVIFGGKERTYQSWWGVPESRLKNDEEAMLVTASNEGWNELQTDNLLSSASRTFNPYLYQNQVDDYKQDNYQLHFSHQPNSTMTFNTAFHWTPGKGYFEEYRYADEFENYGLAPAIIGDSLITTSDLIRRRWLNNDFYGVTYSINFDKNDWNIIAGGAWNRYDGDHFGQIMWAQIAIVPAEYRYYFNNGDKRDFNSYVKTNYQVNARINAFLDLQYRNITYRATGIENKLNVINIDKAFNFFNPKAGFTFSVNDHHQFYSSYSIGNREPVRDDFVDNPGKTPAHETLRNIEVGYRGQQKNHIIHINYYLMDYNNQLVLTGAVNDVGASVRTNVPESYRMGIELEGQLNLGSRLGWNANLTLSRNKIKTFTEVLYDYGQNFEEYITVERKYTNPNIAFSPNIIAGSALSYSPIRDAQITWLSKYVGKQFLDNTSNDRRALDPYLINDVRLTYTWRPLFVKEIALSLLLNNFLDEQYESNGYTWGYRGGEEEFRENYFFPQAGRNFIAMVAVKF